MYILFDESLVFQLVMISLSVVVVILVCIFS